MTIQIDTSTKTIKIEKNVKAKELFDFLTTVVPNWNEYTIETNTTITYVPYYSEPWWYKKRWNGTDWWYSGVIQGNTPGISLYTTDKDTFTTNLQNLFNNEGTDNRK